jgi:hypothetical protein
MDMAYAAYAAYPIASIAFLVLVGEGQLGPGSPWRYRMALRDVPVFEDKDSR